MKMYSIKFDNTINVIIPKPNQKLREEKKEEILCWFRLPCFSNSCLFFFYLHINKLTSPLAVEKDRSTRPEMCTGGTWAVSIMLNAKQHADMQ